MKPKLLLRIAALIMLLHAFGHTAGVYTWKKPESHVPPGLVKQMVEQKFQFMKTESSMASFYDGFGYASTIALVLIFFLLWVIAGLAEKAPSISFTILLPIFFFLVFLALDELIFFFPFATAFTTISAVFTLLAIISLKKNKVQ